MTTDEALDRLRPDWSIGKDEDYLTDEPGWAVYSLMNGEQYERLGWGKTIVEAIEAAEAYVAKEEREAAERRADYERRKAAGQLTPLEMTNELVGTMWSGEVFQTLNTTSVLADRFNRGYEDEVAEQGDTITIRTRKGYGQ